MEKQKIGAKIAHVFEKSGLAPYVRKMDSNEDATILMQNCMLQLTETLSSEKGLNTYQSEALETAIYPKNFKVLYPTLGLTGEAGEVSDKVKKLIRDNGYVGGATIDEQKREDLALELGDVLWYVATLANDLGYSLEQIANMNYQKLCKRKEQGKISGSGDHRQDATSPIEHELPDRLMLLTTMGTLAALGVIFGFVIGLLF